MTVEIRLTTPARLTEVLDLPVDAVSIGQEGCAAKLPEPAVLREAVGRVRAAGLRAGLVLPAGWQRGAADLVTLTTALAEDGPLTVSVNDLGTLAVLAARSLPNCELAVGLALFPGRPHHSAEAPRGPLEAAVYEDGYLAELEEFGVRILETDADAVVPERPGWSTRRLADVTPVAWARSCPTARHHQQAPPDCHTLCDTPTSLVAAQRWQLGHGHREPIPVADRPRQVPLTVYGNAVYATSTTATPQGDDVIIDARFHAPDALADRITTLRPHATAASF
ncbi:hypothetical protein ACIBLA_33030 [Streptomyces sp. NPDC050433]|uniref:hypothetical protein n=1 Tax=unclassified Streptomyces TaxID=2593676 RepID=UPI00344653B5